MKYLPKFSGEGEVTTKEHLETYYIFTNDHKIEHQDVWMRMFMQSLEGEARKWFRGLPPNSIKRINYLDDAFQKH